MAIRTRPEPVKGSFTAVRKIACVNALGYDVGDEAYREKINGYEG